MDKRTFLMMLALLATPALANSKHDKTGKKDDSNHADDPGDHPDSTDSEPDDSATDPGVDAPAEPESTADPGGDAGTGVDSPATGDRPDPRGDGYPVVTETNTRRVWIWEDDFWDEAFWDEDKCRRARNIVRSCPVK